MQKGEIVKRIAILMLFCCACLVCSFAQKNELSFTVGALHSSDQTEDLLLGITCPLGVPNCTQINSSTSLGVAFQGAYARQLFSFGAGSLDVELPVAGAPGRDVKISSTLIPLPGTLSTTSLFFTPSARIKLLHSSPISPFASIGAGLAHFGSQTRFPSIAIGPILVPSRTLSNSTNHGALQFGGGLDFKTPLPHLALRAEVRDFWAPGITKPSSLVRVSPERQHNVFAGGGLALLF